MAKYHINNNGEAGLCRATKGSCPFGGSDEHFDSLEEARGQYEQKWAGAVAIFGNYVNAKGDYESSRSREVNRLLWPEKNFVAGGVTEDIGEDFRQFLREHHLEKSYDLMHNYHSRPMKAEEVAVQRTLLRLAPEDGWANAPKPSGISPAELTLADNLLKHAKAQGLTVGELREKNQVMDDDDLAVELRLGEQYDFNRRLATAEEEELAVSLPKGIARKDLSVKSLRDLVPPAPSFLQSYGEQSYPLDVTDADIEEMLDRGEDENRADAIANAVEQKLFNLQDDYIRENYGETLAEGANSGWGISRDENNSPVIETKLYDGSNTVIVSYLDAHGNAVHEEQ